MAIFHISNSTNYSPFGVELYERGFTRDEYRYSFQSQESDPEIKGAGNSINYKYRMYDPRLGRFFAVDPLTPDYPELTPYQFSSNRVIDYVELEGLEGKPYKKPRKTGSNFSGVGFLGKLFGKTGKGKYLHNNVWRPYHNFKPKVDSKDLKLGTPPEKEDGEKEKKPVYEWVTEIEERPVGAEIFNPDNDMLDEGVILKPSSNSGTLTIEQDNGNTSLKIQTYNTVTGEYKTLFDSNLKGGETVKVNYNLGENEILVKPNSNNVSNNSSTTFSEKNIVRKRKKIKE